MTLSKLINTIKPCTPADYRLINEVKRIFKLPHFNVSRLSKEWQKTHTQLNAGQQFYTFMGDGLYGLYALFVK